MLLQIQGARKRVPPFRSLFKSTRFARLVPSSRDPKFLSF
jgi:hypothetical protein